MKVKKLGVKGMNGNSISRALAFAVPGLAALMLLIPSAFAAVGRTEAAYGVTPNGAPNYTIPIRATEGVNGLTPKIAVTYVGPAANSRVGLRGELHSRSILGVGFDIDGFSYVKPCPQTIAQDGTASPVTLTATDRYCLDGARLRIIGSGTYGASGTQYRTELDQLIRVTIMGVTNGVPSWFKVERPNGLIYEYGNSTDSKLLSGTQTGATPQFWAVSKIVDLNGNAIRFVYENDAASNRFRPSTISYTEIGGTGHYKVEFVYQTGTQPTVGVRYTPSSTSSAVHKQDKLLDRIELKHDDVVYLAYKFTYQAADGNSQRLWQLQECAYAPSEDCLPATSLTWLSATAGHDALASSGKNVDTYVLPLDINGDGIQDLVWPSGGTWRYMLGGPSGFGAIFNTSVAATNPTKAMVLRWNADNFDDLLIDWSDGKWRVLRGGASGFNTTVVAAGSPNVTSTPTGYTTTVGDLNADGLDDLLQMQLNAALSITVRFNGASGFGSSSVAYADSTIHTKGNSLFIKMTGASSVRRPDFNGDGRVDLLVWGCIWDQELNNCIGPPTRWYQLLSQGTTFVNQGPIPGANYAIDARFGNFNDDRLTDIIYPNTSGNWSIGFGQGNGFNVVSGPSHSAHATYQTLIGDYDGDGLDDLYVTKNSPWQWEILRSNGSGFDAAAIPTSISADGLGWMLIDQNGDSPPDLGRYDISTYLWRIGAHAGEPGDHLLNASDGLGNSVAFAYLPMTDATVYVKGSGATTPIRDIKEGQILVRTMQVAPAGGTSYTLTHKYYTAREDVQGRGYLGMGKHEITDSRDGDFATETFRQDFPYIGAPDTVTVKQSSAGNAKTIKSQSNTYLNHILETAAGKQRYLPYRSQFVSNGFEVGGIRNGDQITQVTETRTVNTWGNPTFVSVDVKDMDSLSLETGLVYRTEVTSTYVEDQTSWCIGPPLTRSEKRILPSGTNTTRSVNWVVPPAECRVTQETLEPGGGSLLSLVTDVGYDSCGNVHQITSQPAGTSGQGRVTTIDYGSRCQRPETITNAESHVSTFAYNWPLALPATATDPNGLATILTYDGFGRLTRKQRPDDTGVRFALTACTSGNGWCGKNSGARVEVTRTERSNTDAVLRTDEAFLDGLGRTRWTHTASLESGPAIIETLYDAFGRVSQQTQPYYSGGAVFATVLTRDMIGRVTSLDAPISEGQTSGRITGYQYQGRNVLVTDPGTQITTRTSNVLGQLLSIADPGTGGVTQYTYHPFGELASIKDANNNVTAWTVNNRGFITNTSDADAGNWTYEVSAFGETAKIRDAKTVSPAWTTQFTFDNLSRVKTRVEAEGQTTFTWGKLADNTASNKYIGRLKTVSSPGGYVEDYRYDDVARLTRLRTTIEATDYDFNYVYLASNGLLNTAQYPVSQGSARFRIQFQYQNNLLKRVKEYQGTTTYWEGNSTDAWGHYQDEQYGNGIVEISDFDQASGLMTSREAGVGGGTGRINSLVDWHTDLRGNVTQRQDLKLSPAVTETFVNDSISRLDYSNLNSSQNLDLNYDAKGNIISKDGQNYVYTGTQTGCSYYAYTQPHAVRKVGSTVYCYDANGNMIKRGGSTIIYASYNLPTVINQGSNSSTLSYGAFRNRYKQVAVASGTTETTIYVAGLFERVTLPSGVIEYRHYIPGGNGTAAIHTRRTTGIYSTYYWHADHMGSPELFTDSSATALVRPSFGALGERRDGSDWSGPPSGADLTVLASITRRGFTGHEHLDNVGLIHMNGRVYDPGVGRFLSADPILRLGLSQDVNRYSYAWNNPLNVSDPSGFDEDTTVVQCIGADYCPGSNVPAGAFDDIDVIGRRVDTPAGGWGSAGGADLANQMASWGSGIDLAIDLGNGVERQFAGPDGEVNVTATRLGPSPGPGSLANKGDSEGESTGCSGGRVNNRQERFQAGPDYVSLAVPLAGLLGISLTTDRYGNSYLGIGIGFGYPAFGVSAGYIGDASTGSGYSSNANDQYLEIPSATVSRKFNTGLNSYYGAILGVTISGSSQDGGRSAMTITGPAFGVGYSLDAPPWLSELTGSRCRN